MPKAFILLSTPSDILISVMFGLIRSFDRYADVIGLLLSQFGQFDADALQVEAGNFFVQTFRQAVDTYFVRHCPQIHLGQDLICEGVAHYERRMACRATQVHQAAFCQQEDRVACRECVLVNLRFGCSDSSPACRPGFRCRNGRCCKRWPGLSSGPYVRW